MCYTARGCQSRIEFRQSVIADSSHALIINSQRYAQLSPRWPAAAHGRQTESSIQCVRSKLNVGRVQLIAQRAVNTGHIPKL